MTNFNIIKLNLEAFIRKYYKNALIKGTILFFTLGVLYFILTLLVEYFLWLNPLARTFLFWLFIVVEFILFSKFIIIPLTQLFKLRKGINYEKASVIIGNHFAEINDKLLNILQLYKSKQQSDLLIASIEQKSNDLKLIKFRSAIDFKSNLKYLKYLAIPLIFIFIVLASGKLNWFTDSYTRVLNYQTAYQPPAPFQFFVLNKDLQTIENQSYNLNVSTLGRIIPENASITYNNQSYLLQQQSPGTFQHTFAIPKAPITFVLEANGIRSKPYTLNVISTPNLVKLSMELSFPKYTKRQNIVLTGTGNAVVPEGTKITWVAETKNTSNVALYAQDTLDLKKNNTTFRANKTILKPYNYSISTSNSNLSDFENLAYTISVVKDKFPELDIQLKKDSLDLDTLYFYGKASDDYGLSHLEMVYYPYNQKDSTQTIPIDISLSTFSEFVTVFPNQLNLTEGESYEIYFQVFDNDNVNKKKRTKSPIFSYRKATAFEQEEFQLNQQSKTINQLGKSFDEFQKQNNTLDKFSILQKEKKDLSFNDKKTFENFIKRQKQLEELMKNFNKNLQNNLEEFQQESQKQDLFKEDLKQRLKENEAQLKKDEKLLEELERLKDKINKEEFSQKLDELAKQNKSKKRSMKQLLELTKRFYVMKKTEKIISELEKLSEKQVQLSKQDDQNKSNKQEELNTMFNSIQDDLDALEEEDNQLKEPTKVPRDEFLEDEISFNQEQAKKALEEQEHQDINKKPTNNSKQNAIDQQQKVAKKIKALADKMKQQSSGGSGTAMEEDSEALRQILDNLLLFSFDEEALMNTFKSIETDNNNYGKNIIKQGNLREHFKHIDDSLFALSLRQPKISQKVNSLITDIYFSIDKALDQLSENRISVGLSAQQYTITYSNELASFLSDTLDNMQINPQMGKGDGEGMQLPDIIMTQEELNKKMKEQLDNKKESKEKEGNTSNQSPSKSSDSDQGKQDASEGNNNQGSQESKTGEQGEKDSSGNTGEEGQNGQEGQDSSSAKKGQSRQQGNPTQQGKQGQGGNKGQNKSENQGNSTSNDGVNNNNNTNTSTIQPQEGTASKADSQSKTGTNANENDSNKGYGEGGKEEQNAELFDIYKTQQLLRQALEDRIENQKNNQQSAGELIKQMEEVELDLLNRGFTNQTLQKMMDIQHQLLKLENATFLQGEDTKRESRTNTKAYNSANKALQNKAKQYFNTTEILNRQSLPLKQHLQKKINHYFNTLHD